MIKRTNYLDKIRPFINTDVIEEKNGDCHHKKALP